MTSSPAGLFWGSTDRQWRPEQDGKAAYVQVVKPRQSGRSTSRMGRICAATRCVKVYVTGAGRVDRSRPATVNVQIEARVTFTVIIVMLLAHVDHHVGAS